LAALDAWQVGLAAVGLGAAWQRKGDPIHHAVGVVLRKKVGDQTEAGEPLLTVQANDQRCVVDAQARLLAAYRWDETQVEPPALIRRIIR
jgi:pyrimidine-nucleoside phosphorylase